MAWQVRTMVAAVALAGIGFLPGLLHAQGGATATLSVLSTPVELIGVADGTRQPGRNGMNLAEGDRVRTGGSGVALITFLDGATVTVQPDSEVTVRQVDRGRDRSGIRLLIHAGRVWARVARGAGRGSGLTLESNEYAAAAHDGLIGAEHAPDGTFICWTRRGEVRLTDRIGHTLAMLAAGQRARVVSGQPVTPEPFRPSASTLEVRSDGPVVPLVRMPDGRVAAGFLAGEVEVNQVFGSLTESLGRGRWLVEVPGGLEGPYTLILTGTGAGPYTVAVSARYGGLAVYRQDLKGVAAPGERQFTRIRQGVAGDDARSARVLDASFEGLRAWDGADPGAAGAAPGGRRPGLN